MPGLTSLEEEIVAMIVEECAVPEVPADISADDPIIGDGSLFGLDSLHAVAIVVGIQKRFGVRIGDQTTSRRVLRSLRTLSRYIEERRSEAAPQ